MEVCGREVTRVDVAAHRAAGLAYVPEDRAAVGSALGGERRRQSGDGIPSRRSALPRTASSIRRHSRSGRARLSGASPSESRTSASTSGRYRAATCRRSSSPANSSHEAPALIAEQPTRGLDVGATEHIHQQLVAERDRGRAVLLVSAELGEILALVRPRAGDVRGSDPGGPPTGRRPTSRASDC